MILKFYELKNNLKDKNLFLFYGKNSGLIEETINIIIKPNASKNIYNYDEKEIIDNTDSFKETILNNSFFENDKLIIINRVTDKILEVIEEIIEKNIGNIKVILKSDILEKKSKIRTFFEKNLKTIAVPFYEDNDQTMVAIAQNYFKQKNIQISSQNINLIVQRAKGNRINLKNELEKISNYIQNKKSINTDEIIKLTNLAENYNISELVDHCLAKNKKKTLNILNENNPSDEDNIIILKTFLFKLKRLKKLKLELKINKNTDSVLSSFKPPIFWKDKDIIKQQLDVLTINQINQLMNEVSNIELLIKKNSQISNYITNNFILEKL